MSAGAVLLAGALYLVTAPPDRPHVRVDLGGSDAPSAGTTTEPTPTSTPTGSVTGAGGPAQQSPGATSSGSSGSVDRGASPVVVLNDSKVSGLAARTSVTLQGLGWDVQDSANWQGVALTEPTVYYPAGQEDAARALAADLGIGAVLPMPGTMPEKRLTVVLTGSFTTR